jgi:hypothetical protein
MPKNVQDGDHVARYCSFQKLVHEPTLSVIPAAFELRQHKDEKFLSVNHCEHHVGARLAQLKAVLTDLTAKTFNWSKSGAFAIANAKLIRDCGKARSRDLRVRRRHHEKDQSYASIDGLPLDNSDRELLALLAADATAEVHLIKSVLTS